MKLDLKNTAALILSGGKAMRMGGVDKGLVLFNDVPLIQYVLDILPNEIDWRAISANRNFDLYEKFGIPIFADEEKWRDMGPLAGLASLIKLLPTKIQSVLMLPCDTPFLPKDLITKLHSEINNKSENMACYAQTEDGKQPSILLIKRAALVKLPDYLQRGGRKIISYLETFESSSVFFSDTKNFTNLNDYQTLIQQENKYKNIF